MILFYCPNGYVYQEIYEFLIKDLCKDEKSVLLIADYHLNNRIIDLIKEFKSQGKIETFIICNPDQKKGENLSDYQSRLEEDLKLLNQFSFKKMVKPLEYPESVFCQYLSIWAKSKNAKIISLQIGTLWRLLKDQRESQGYPVFPEGDQRNQKGYYSLINKAVRKIKQYANIATTSFK